MIESLWFVKARDAIGLSLLFLFCKTSGDRILPPLLQSHFAFQSNSSFQEILEIMKGSACSKLCHSNQLPGGKCAESRF